MESLVLRVQFREPRRLRKKAKLFPSVCWSGLRVLCCLLRSPQEAGLGVCLSSEAFPIWNASLGWRTGSSDLSQEVSAVLRGQLGAWTNTEPSWGLWLEARHLGVRAGRGVQAQSGQAPPGVSEGSRVAGHRVRAGMALLFPAGSSTRPSGPAGCARWPSPAAPRTAQQSHRPRRPVRPPVCPA